MWSMYAKGLLWHTEDEPVFSHFKHAFKQFFEDETINLCSWFAMK